MAHYGYGRVSSQEQTSENQRRVIALQQKKVIDEWFEDHNVSGKTKAEDRPEFSRMIAKAVAGDTIVITRVDRVGRKASNTLKTVEALLDRGIEVFILQLGDIPLSSQTGKLLLGVFAILAEGERDAVIERTKDGLARTKAQGTVLGAVLKIKPNDLKDMVALHQDGMNINAIAAKYKLPRNTVDRNIKAWGTKLEEYTQEYNKRQIQIKEKRKQK
jgi:DNA invertase Pin-like site-specific DNA recombinase